MRYSVVFPRESGIKSSGSSVGGLERESVKTDETKGPTGTAENSREETAPQGGPPMRIYGLLALGFLAGVGEHYTQFGLNRLTGIRVPFTGAILAGAALGLILRRRRGAVKIAVFLAMVLVARTATLYMDYARYRDRRIEQFAATKRITDALAVQKLSLQAYSVDKIGGLNARELFERELRQLGGRADFFGYLRMLLRRGLRNAAGRRIAGAWGVTLFLLASSAILGASCVVLCCDTSFATDGSPEEPVTKT